MSDLTTLQKICIALILCVGVWIALAPWLSLINLNKLGDIAYELRKIREALERRKE